MALFVRGGESTKGYWSDWKMRRRVLATGSLLLSSAGTFTFMLFSCFQSSHAHPLHHASPISCR